MKPPLPKIYIQFDTNLCVTQSQNKIQYDADQRIPLPGKMLWNYPAGPKLSEFASGRYTALWLHVNFDLDESCTKTFMGMRCAKFGFNQNMSMGKNQEHTHTSLKYTYIK